MTIDRSISVLGDAGRAVKIRWGAGSYLNGSFLEVCPFGTDPLKFPVLIRARKDREPTYLLLGQAHPKVQEAALELIKRASVASFHPFSKLRRIFDPPVGG